jgi:aspartate/methionine/tyrosine aminotransferase
MANSQVSSFTESIFSKMSRLSLEHEAINLSQGFPNFRGPDFLTKLACDQITDPQMDKNQYAPSRGIPKLRHTLKQRYESDYNLTLNPDTEIVITNGATEGIFCAIMSLCNPGDEVIVLEPFYDSYIASIKMAHAIAIPVTLEGPDFSPDVAKIKKAITPRTRAIIVNSPHNPTGRILTDKEQRELAQVVIDHDLILICDEVYEHLTFDQKKHRPMMAINELRDRTITISSAGKTFGLTGWKIGWVIASAPLSHAIHMVHQFTTFSVATPLQWAVASALENPASYIKSFQTHYQGLRDLFCKGLEELNLPFLKPEGSYFCLMPTPSSFKSDEAFCEKLVKEIKVSAIPCSAFYLTKPVDSYVRFCFAKDEATLKQALVRLAKIGK